MMTGAAGRAFILVNILHTSFHCLPVYKSLFILDLQVIYPFDSLIKSNKAKVLNIHHPQPSPLDPVIGYSVELFVFKLEMSSDYLAFCLPGFLPHLICQKVTLCVHRWSFNLHTCPTQSHFSLFTEWITFLLVLNFFLIFVILILSFSLMFSMNLSIEFCADWIFFSFFFVIDQVWHPYVNTRTTQPLKMWLLYDIGKLFFRMNPKLHNLLQAKAILRLTTFSVWFWNVINCPR